MTRLVSRLAVLAGTLVLPGFIVCAPAVLAGQPTAQLNRPSQAVSNSTILAMRQVPAHGQPGAGIGGLTGGIAGGLGAGVGGGANGAAGGGTWSSMLVTGFGGGSLGRMASGIGQLAGNPAPQAQTIAPQAQTIAPQAQTMEFKLRMDDGSALTVVQSNDQGLHVGDRVHVIRGERPQIVRGG